MYSQSNQQSGYATAQFPYGYSGAPPFYYPSHQQTGSWQPPQVPPQVPPPQDWSASQPAQSWGQPCSTEPPPPGTGGENSSAQVPPEGKFPPPPAPAPVGWQANNYWQQWPAQGWTGVDQWNGHWPPQPVYWSSSYNYANQSYPTDVVAQPAPVSRLDKTPPSQNQDATPPPPPAAAEEDRLHQPRIQQYSQAGYTTEFPPLGPSQPPKTSGQQALLSTAGGMQQAEPERPQALLPLPAKFAQQQSGDRSWSERRGEDQPPARKRASRWEQPPSQTITDSKTTTEDTSSKNPTGPLTPEQWPPKLREYIDRAFAACNGRASDLERVQQFLKVELNEIFRQNRAWEVDWDHKPLPLEGQPPPSHGSRWDTPSPTHSDLQSRSSYQPVTPTIGGAGRGRRKKGALKKRRGGKMFFIDKTGDEVTEVEQQRLDQRALRFADGNRSYKKKLSVAELVAAATAGSREEGDLNWEEFAIEGTSQALEKPYLRLTSAPDPSAVRALPVLRQSLVHVLGRWRQKGDYRYTCEQFKSIRQDLTIQGIRNEFAVEVYESHARIALEKGDRGEFNQCQAQLKALYLEGVPGQEAEFVAYRILYLILTHNSADMSTELRELTSDLRTHPYVAHALRLWSAWQLGNYCQFFRLFESAPGSGRSLLQLFVSRERLSALRTILKAFRPSVPLAHVSQALALSLEECREWLAELELPASGPQLDCKACLSLLQAKATAG